MRQLTILIALMIAVPAFAYDIDSPYGVVAFIPSPTRWDAMRDANVTWNRCGFSWRDIETSKGTFNWTQTDEMVNAANARGLEIYAGLGYTPAWASGPAYPQHRSQDPPANPQDWYDFVFACVSRYKDSIKYWELWNEPNISGFWNDTRQRYIDNIVKKGSDAAHAADPDCFVLAPEISRCCSGDTWMLDVLNQAGNKIDIISHHQYDYVSPQNRLSAATMSIDQMHNLLVANGWGNKPIWVTECGWDSDGAGNSETTQANNLVAMLAGMQSRPWWRKFFWYQIWEGPTGRAGLLYQDETRKPSWYAYRDYTVAHPAPQYVSVNLSTTDIVNGITRVSVGDGNTTPDTRANRACRRNVNPASDFYMYFNVTDSFSYQGNRPAVTIYVDYHDLGAGSFSLQYDATDGNFYKNTAPVARANKDTWKQAMFTLTDAYFGNRQNSGADFRIAGNVGMTFHIDVVQVNAAYIAPPGQPSNPNPADAATLVSLTPTLSWTAGSNALSHDVYFGTTSPGTFQGNQAGATFNPGTLAEGTTYYWRIDGNNLGGTTTGPVWSFTTVIIPSQAGNPIPASGTTAVSTSAALSWTAGSDATSHDVYFGTSPGAPGATFQGNQAGTTFNPSMSPGTLYYWRIDEKNGPATTTGTVWMFRTTSIPRADFDGDGDVDSSDFGHLQNCFNGFGPVLPGCEDSDLNASNSVDTSDFNAFLPCMGGANLPPGC